jgi:dienelactone hydrolase
MRQCAGLAVTLIVAPSLGEVKTQKVDYRDGDVVLVGYLTYDDAIEGKRPGVLVCHEWWGNNEYSRERAEQLAGLGYVAFALDMYGDGRTTEDPKKAGEMAGIVRSDGALVRRRAGAGLKVLAESPRVDPERIAAIGYCMGGTVALELARSGADLAAVVCFHGGLGTKEPAKAGAIKGKVLVCNGAEDEFVPDQERVGFEKEMKDADVDYVFIDYAGAVHAFTNPGADAHNLPGVAYNETADRRSWRHMIDLFDEALGKVEAGAPDGDPSAE